MRTGSSSLINCRPAAMRGNTCARLKVRVGKLHRRPFSNLKVSRPYWLTLLVWRILAERCRAEKKQRSNRLNGSCVNRNALEITQEGNQDDQVTGSGRNKKPRGMDGENERDIEMEQGRERERNKTARAQGKRRHSLKHPLRRAVAA